MGIPGPDGKPFIFAAGADVTMYTAADMTVSARSRAAAQGTSSRAHQGAPFSDGGRDQRRLPRRSVEIALHCSARRSRPRAAFRRAGGLSRIVPAWGGTQLVPMLVGVRRPSASSSRTPPPEPGCQRDQGVRAGLRGPAAGEGRVRRRLDCYAIELAETGGGERSEALSGTRLRSSGKRAPGRRSGSRAAPAPMQRSTDRGRRPGASRRLRPRERGRFGAAPLAAGAGFALRLRLVEFRAKRGEGIPSEEPRRVQKWASRRRPMATQLATLFLRRLELPPSSATQPCIVDWRSRRFARR